MEAIFLLFFWIGFCCIVGAFASKTGRSFWGWTGLACLISPLLSGIVLLVVYLVQDDGPNKISHKKENSNE